VVVGFAGAAAKAKPKLVRWESSHTKKRSDVQEAKHDIQEAKSDDASVGNVDMV
jgi:ATP-dependent protease HslVU (ClpYQ) peptidase subunit